ncbi:MAG: proprotein convertase P-domain-containing protein [Bacteroidota bacterium]
MQRVLLLLVLITSLGVAHLSAKQPASGDLSRIPVISLPKVDNEALIRQEMAARRPGRAPHFAVPHAVDIRPTTHGLWTEHNDGTTSWQIRLQSEGAKTLNLGFTEYWMPRGGQLFLYSGGQKQPTIHGPFTQADNEVHDQLWTQIIEGDDLIVEVMLPTREKSNLRLWLTSVNHDFIGFGTGAELSGSCNLDVVCSAEDGWGIVDGYRDIIRSVAVMSEGGTTFCTGFLVNNARQDCTPYFMTANHCGTNAPALVVYWNFINSVCRQPFSGASGGNGDGQLVDFNSGAILRANYADSDVTIVELDDEVSPTADAFFAGWSREMAEPGDTVIAIHHPSTDEKRISFSFQQTYRSETDFSFPSPSRTPDPNGNQIAVPDWDIGTTEGGSSGSPIFDRFKRVRGQLFGGGAACGNDEYDSYGYFHVSWEGGGTPNSRLKDWLDPDDTGIMFIDGREQLACQTSVRAESPSLINCAPETTTYDLLVGGGFTDQVTVSISDLPAGLNAMLSATSVAPNTPITLSVTPDPGISGSFSFNVDATDGSQSSSTPLSLNLLGGVPTVPLGALPANGATAQPLIITLGWGNVIAEDYNYQLATDASFTNVIFSGTTESNSITYNSQLTAQTTYYWRVSANNICGASEWSPTSSFRTLESQVCGAATVSDDVPVSITPNGTPNIFSTLEVESTTPISFMTVSVDIEHTWVGDLEITLMSPEGTEVTLVDRIGTPDDNDFGCGGDDFIVTFSDGAMNTYDDLENTCNDAPAVNGEFLPLESLAEFNNEDPEGTWLLTIEDNADDDGGDLIGWNIVFCGATGGGNFSVTNIGENPEACPADGAEITLQLGEDFGGEISTSVSIDGNEVTNFTPDYNSATRVLTISFADFITVAPGIHTIEVAIISPDGSNSIMVPLTIVSLPGLASLLSPPNEAVVDNSGTVQFEWSPSARANDYTLQISADETFTTVDYSAPVSGTNLEVSDLTLDGLLYWRIIANNDCGNTTSGSFNFTLSPITVHNFADDKALSLYPNPASDLLTLDMTGSWQGELKVSLLSVHGQRMGNWSLAAGGRQQLDLSVLPAGTYLVDLRNGTDRAVERLVIVR